MQQLIMPKVLKLFWFSMFVRFETAATNSPGVQRVRMKMAYDGSMVDDQDDAGQDTLGMRRTEGAAQYVHPMTSSPEVRRVFFRTSYDGSTFDVHDGAAPGVRRMDVAQDGRAEYSSTGMQTITSDHAVDVRRVASRNSSNGDVDKRANGASEMEIHSPSRRANFKTIVDLTGVAAKFSDQVKNTVAHGLQSLDDSLAAPRSNLRLKAFFLLAFVGIVAVRLFLCLTYYSDKLRVTRGDGSLATEARLSLGTSCHNETERGDGEHSDCADASGHPERNWSPVIAVSVASDRAERNLTVRPHTQCDRSGNNEQRHPRLGDLPVAVRVPSMAEVVADALTIDASSDEACSVVADTSSDEAPSVVAGTCTDGVSSESYDVCARCQMPTGGRGIEVCDQCALQAHASLYPLRSWPRAKRRSSRA
jgi:hypothetical protein